MGEAKRKLARNGTNDENAVPGSHGPAQAQAVDAMKAALDCLREVLPGWQFTLFAFEPETAAKGRLPRYTYMSTADRRDMVAVLRAFVARNSEMEKIDAAMAGKPEGAA